MPAAGGRANKYQVQYMLSIFLAMPSALNSVSYVLDARGLAPSSVYFKTAQHAIRDFHDFSGSSVSTSGRWRFLCPILDAVF